MHYRCDVKSLNILSNIPSGRLHRPNGLDSTSSTSMRFLLRHVSPVTARGETREIRSHCTAPFKPA